MPILSNFSFSFFLSFFSFSFFFPYLKPARQPTMAVVRSLSHGCVSFACGSLDVPQVWAGWLVSGVRGGWSGRGGKGVANVYTSCPPFPAGVSPLKPSLAVPHGRYGKAPRGAEVPEWGRGWACIYL